MQSISAVQTVSFVKPFGQEGLSSSIGKEVLIASRQVIDQIMYFSYAGVSRSSACVIAYLM